MLKARPAKEIVLRQPNQVGALNVVAKTLSDKGINILGVCAWVEGEQAVVRLLTDDTGRVADSLKGAGRTVSEADIIVTDVPHKPGMLRRLADTLAQDGRDIRHLYATASATQDQCLVAFATDNNDRAIVRLNAKTR